MADCVIVLSDMQGAFIPAFMLVSSDWTFAFGDYFFYQLLSIDPFPKNLDPKNKSSGDSLALN